MLVHHGCLLKGACKAAGLPTVRLTCWSDMGTACLESMPRTLASKHKPALPKSGCWQTIDVASVGPVNPLSYGVLSPRTREAPDLAAPRLESSCASGTAHLGPMRPLGCSIPACSYTTNVAWLVPKHQAHSLATLRLVWWPSMGAACLKHQHRAPGLCSWINVFVCSRCSLTN